MIRSKLASLSLALMLGLLSTLSLVAVAPASAADQPSTLGIAMQVQQGDDDSSGDLNKNNRLWFVIEPGASGSRSFEIRSSSQIDQVISMSLGAQANFTGKLEYDPEGVTPIAEWASFDKNNFVLKANTQTMVNMTITVPKGSPIDTYEPTLLIKASAVKQSKAQYKLTNALQLAHGMFVGVGTSDQMRTAFTIDDVNGATTNEGRVLLVKFSNTGKTPIALTGDLQLRNLTFETATVGPLSFATDTIAPGESTTIAVPATEQITEDNWRILVTAKQGSIVMSRSFDKELSFAGTNWVWVAQIGGLIAFGSAILALVAIRTLRKMRRDRLAGIEAERLEAERIANLERELQALREAQVAAGKKASKPAAKRTRTPKAEG